MAEAENGVAPPQVPGTEAEDCSNEASSSENIPELTHRWTLHEFSKYLPGEKVHHTAHSPGSQHSV